MGKFILLGLIALAFACKPAESARTDYRGELCEGDKYVFRRNFVSECDGYNVDTVTVTDVMQRCVKIRNTRGVEVWTSSKYFRYYITPLNK